VSKFEERLAATRLGWSWEMWEQGGKDTFYGQTMLLRVHREILVDQIHNKIEDILHFLLFRKPVWPEAGQCDSRFCKMCGGRWGRH